MGSSSKPTLPQGRSEARPPTNLWRERQERDYRKANGLCYLCAEKYEPSHAEKCTNRPKSQLNAIVVNDLDVNLTEEVLTQLAVEDSRTDDFCHLSLHALSTAEDAECIKIRALVKKKDNSHTHGQWEFP
ncbi:uncharacterized protein C2845_PM15G02420 [Panicum miliaceum]|uniref:Uncharacterized protein n=1 Tax=Panicum miliaceum TaxID=4540 RepID=A0A3L6Q6E2_PANMI|nr:uncharacterized protein C2845_PM15G02420 [Panicum miliaceum]